MKKRITIYLVAALASVILPILLSAQTDANNNQPFQEDPSGPPPPNDAPIDGGLGFLLAAGTAYGVKKYREGRKRRERSIL